MFAHTDVDDWNYEYGLRECFRNDEDLSCSIPFVIADSEIFNDLYPVVLEIAFKKAVERAIERNELDDIQVLMERFSVGSNIDVTTAAINSIGKNPDELKQEPKLDKDAVNAVYYEGMNLLMLTENADVMKFLISQGIDIEKRDIHGNTPLMYAVTSDKPECVKVLLDAGADVNAVNDNGNSVLFEASLYSNIDIINMLLAAGADVKKLNNQQQSVLWAALDVDVFIALVKAGADVNTKDAEGNTLWSILFKDEEFIDAMIEAGADVNITDKKGRTPLMYCVSYDSKTCVETLISAGANVKAKSHFGYKVIDYAKNVDMFEYLIEAGAKFDIKDYHDSFLVHYALRDDNDEMIKAIFSKTKNINCIMGDGRTVLSDAVLWSSYYNFTNDVNFYISELIDMGANPKVKDKSGHIAMNYFDYEWNEGTISMWSDLIDDMDELDLFDIRYKRRLYKRRPESRLLAKAEAKNELLNLFLDETDGDYYSEHYFECVDSCCINDRNAPCIHGDFDDENNHVPICNDDCETMKFVLQEASGKSAKK